MTEVYEHVFIDAATGERTVVPFTQAEINARQPTLEQARADKLDALAAKRWEVETGGIVLPNGVGVPTDRQTASILTAAYVKATADANYLIPRFKVAPTVSVPLDAQTIIMIADAVEAHIQACFEREGELIDAILAASDIAALNAINIETDWP